MGFGWLVGWVVFWFVKEREVTLPCSYRSTCLGWTLCWLEEAKRGTEPGTGKNLAQLGKYLAQLDKDKA